MLSLSVIIFVAYLSVASSRHYPRGDPFDTPFPEDNDTKTQNPRPPQNESSAWSEVIPFVTYLTPLSTFYYPRGNIFAKHLLEDKELAKTLQPRQSQEESSAWSEEIPFVTYLKPVPTRYFPTGHPFARLLFENKQPTKRLSPRLSQDEISASSEVMVIKLHYDCSGRLTKHEVSKLQPQIDVGRGPDFKGYKIGPQHKQIEKTPQNFGSIPSRIRTTTTTTTARSPVEEKNTVEFIPDRIIDTPMLPCPPGQNEDYLGKCRNVFPEYE